MSDGDAEGIIPPICALRSEPAKLERKTERDVLMTDCPRGSPAVSSAVRKLIPNRLLGNRSSLVAYCLPIRPSTRMGQRRAVVRLVQESEASRRRRSRVFNHDVCRSGSVTGSKGTGSWTVVPPIYVRVPYRSEHVSQRGPRRLRYRKQITSLIFCFHRQVGNRFRNSCYRTDLCILSCLAVVPAAEISLGSRGFCS